MMQALPSESACGFQHRPAATESSILGQGGALPGSPGSREQGLEVVVTGIGSEGLRGNSLLWGLDSSPCCGCLWNKHWGS